MRQRSESCIFFVNERHGECSSKDIVKGKCEILDVLLLQDFAIQLYMMDVYNFTMKRIAVSSSLSTVIDPPCAWTIARAADRPIP